MNGSTVPTLCEFGTQTLSGADEITLDAVVPDFRITVDDLFACLRG